MYTTCDCVRRNGLQDKCPRSLCQGKAACMTLPTPSCCPATGPLRYVNITMGTALRSKNSEKKNCSSNHSKPACSPKEQSSNLKPVCGEAPAPCNAPTRPCKLLYIFFLEINCLQNKKCKRS